jgi:hypothetical protein
MVSVLALAVSFSAAYASWEWQQPLPQGNLLYSVWGSSSSNVFAVGGNGTILKYNGSTWESMTSGITDYLRSVWGSSGSDVFAVSNNGAILHYNGNIWTSMASGFNGSFLAVWGSSSSDVFAVGAAGKISHYDGITWSSMTSGTTEWITGVWGSSSSDVFAVAGNGTLLHYNGTYWSTMTSGTTEDLNKVWGTSGSDVFVTGWNGTILHYNGSIWESMVSGTTTQLYGLWGNSPSDVFAAGESGTILHYNGTSWSSVTGITSNHLYGIGGNSIEGIVAVGEYGTILRYASPISLTKPNGGESWGRNSRQVIRWNAAAGLGNLRISLWQNSTQIGIIADNVNPVAGSYVWNVGAYDGGVAPLGTDYTIRVREKGTALSDESDASFSIVKISVKTPNGGESWQIGSTQNITWVVKSISGNLRIVLLKNGVKVGNIVDSIAPGAGTYAWTVGNYVGGTASAGTGYQVQAREIGTDAGDRSDANFTLTAP